VVPLVSPGNVLYVVFMRFPEFRTYNDEQKLKSFGNLLKLYQQEIDRLSKRNASVEESLFELSNAFLSNKIEDLIKVLESALSHISNLESTLEYQKQAYALELEKNRSLQETLPVLESIKVELDQLRKEKHEWEKQAREREKLLRLENAKRSNDLQVHLEEANDPSESLELVQLKEFKQHLEQQINALNVEKSDKETLLESLQVENRRLQEQLLAVELQASKNAEEKRVTSEIISQIEPLQ